VSGCLPASNRSVFFITSSKCMPLLQRLGSDAKCSTRHGKSLPQETRVRNAFDDVASIIHQSLPVVNHLHHRRLERLHELLHVDLQLALLLLGPGRCCSPRQRTPCSWRDEDLQCVGRRGGQYPPGPTFCTSAIIFAVSFNSFIGPSKATLVSALSTSWFDFSTRMKRQPTSWDAVYNVVDDVSSNVSWDDAVSNVVECRLKCRGSKIW